MQTLQARGASFQQRTLHCGLCISHMLLSFSLQQRYTAGLPRVLWTIPGHWTILKAALPALCHRVKRWLSWLPSFFIASAVCFSLRQMLCCLHCRHIKAAIHCIGLLQSFLHVSVLRW